MVDANNNFETPMGSGRRTKVLLGLLLGGLLLVGFGCEEEYDTPAYIPPNYPLIGEYMAVDWGPNDLMAVDRVIQYEDSTGISQRDWGLYTLREDGTDPKPLTMRPTIDFEWSPDGEWIAFLSGGLQLIRPDGTGLKKLHIDNLISGGVSWSPDGEWIVFSVTTGVVVDRGLWVIRPDGSSLHQLSKPPDDQICEGCNPIHWRARSPDWSSDGRSIAYIPIQSNWIAVYDTVTTQVNVIYKSSSSLNNPQFSPDGKTILFNTSVVAGGMMRIGLIDIDGQNLRWLPVSGKEPSWSPNGNQIIYRRYDISAFTYDGWRVLNPGKGWGDLWVFDLKPAKHSQLTFTNGTWGGS